MDVAGGHWRVSAAGQRSREASTWSFMICWRKPGRSITSMAPNRIISATAWAFTFRRPWRRDYWAPTGCPNSPSYGRSPAWPCSFTGWPPSAGRLAKPSSSFWSSPPRKPSGTCFCTCCMGRGSGSGAGHHRQPGPPRRGIGLQRQLDVAPIPAATCPLGMAGRGFVL